MKIQGTLYIISAPSGAGKTTLVKALVASTERIVVSVSHTTRPRRPKEQDGVNYHFVSKEQFEKLLTENVFLEHATVFGNQYGTSSDWLESQLQAGVDVILEIDWQGAQQARKKMSGEHTVSIFILPPSREILRERLRVRAQDNEAVIAARMAQASNEIAHYHEYDYLVVNDNFDIAVAELQAIVQARRLLLGTQSIKYATLLANLLAENR